MPAPLPRLRGLARDWRNDISPMVISWIAFACILGGALFGMLLRHIVPEHHLSADTKEVVRLGTGVIGLIAAVVLGLLIGSAKSAYDIQSTAIRQLTANFIQLDLILAQYGPEARAARDLLRRGAATLADRIWRENSSAPAKGAPFEITGAGKAFFEKLEELSPSNDAQRSLRTLAVQTTSDLTRTRLLLFAQTGNSIPMPFLVVLIFWLTIIFATFSLFAQVNAITIGSLVLFALSAAGSIYLILELGRPFEGLMQISSEPLRNALAPLTPA
jgi:hypothetical protein